MIGFSQVRLAIDKDTGRPRGFAHVDFKTAEDASRAVAELNGMEVLGRELRVDLSDRDRAPLGGRGAGGRSEGGDGSYNDRPNRGGRGGRGDRYGGEKNDNQDSYGNW